MEVLLKKCIFVAGQFVENTLLTKSCKAKILLYNGQNLLQNGY